MHTYASASQLVNPTLSTPIAFASEQTGNEFAVISDFLESLDESFESSDEKFVNIFSEVPAVNPNESFFLTAADPSDGELKDRISGVINVNAKYEAEFLVPYNYVDGYARLRRFMEANMSEVSRQRILNAIGKFTPTFRAVAKSLTDTDLILVEEEFERLLLDYDRVFSSMGLPACLWRRTGGIFKANKEFASLIGVPIEKLKDGLLFIHELMAEDSTVKYWEKYSNIAFDAGQKAVLTSCLLRNQDPNNDGAINCSFSFTVRRDKYNIPAVIIGNFLPVRPP